MPQKVSAFLLDIYSRKNTLVFSNVPGPRAPYKVAGYKTKNMTFFVPAMMEVAGGLSIISHYDVIKLGLILDKSFTDPKQLMKIFTAKFDEVF